MHPMLNIAVRAARKAGSVINRASLDGAGLEVRSKHQNDFVTRVDTAAEEAILDVVRKSYPDHAILAEESGAAEGRAEYQWIIDPLDGTTNFIHGFPQYCVSIAIRRRDELAHGVVYDPNRNELFTASKGSGAYLNDRRIRVSKCLRLGDALVGTGFPFREGARIDLYSNQLKNIMQKCARVRRGARPCLRGVRPARCVLGAWTVAVGHGRRRASHPGSGRTRRRPARRVRLPRIGRSRLRHAENLPDAARGASPVRR